MRVNLSHHIIFPTALELTSFKKEVKSVLIETSEDVNVISFDDGVGLLEAQPTSQYTNSQQNI